MKSNELKTLIKEAVREVLKEELANLGKQKLQESISTTEEWPTISLNTKNVNPAYRQSLMDQMGITPPQTAAPKTFSEKQNVYQSMLQQVASEMRGNPGDISNFRNIGSVE
jgi:hypothetical protein